MIAVMIFSATSLLTGLLMVFNLNPFALLKNIHWNTPRYKPKATMRSLVEDTRGTRKYNPITRQFVELKELLVSCDREEKYSRYVRYSLACAILGAGLAAILQNLLIMPVLALIGGLVPIWYLKFWAVGYKKMVNSELETALSIVTSSYIRADNLTFAIEENIQHINPPVREVFEKYLVQTRYIDSNTTKAIREIRRMVKNPVYAEWCDSLILCQTNNELKDILPPIVAKLSDTRSIQGELDTICYNAIRETVMLIVLTVANIPLMYFLNHAWYENLLFSLPGHIILFLTGCCIIFAIFRAIRVTRPIEYRR